MTVVWSLLGAACALALSIFMPLVALATVVVLGVVALLRRRVDAYSRFSVGFAVWCVIYVALSVVAILTESPSTGTDQWP